MPNRYDGEDVSAVAPSGIITRLEVDFELASLRLRRVTPSSSLEAVRRRLKAFYGASTGARALCVVIAWKGSMRVADTRPSQEHRRQATGDGVPATPLAAGLFTEAKGFEPLTQLSPSNRLATGHLRPLGHASTLRLASGFLER